MMTEEKKEKLLCYDFEGWPVFKKDLREILDDMGFEKKEVDGKIYWCLSDESPLLDITPRVLHDDGMGYGVNEEWITEFYPVADESGELNWINVFVEKKDDCVEENGVED